MKRSRSLFGIVALGAMIFLLTVSAFAQTESILYNFTGSSDGANPSGALIADTAGNLYGTTSAGGDLSACNGAGCGVVFKLTASTSGWTETVLHTFTGPDGANPASGVVFDASGNLVGTASSGGSFTCHGSGCGVIFMLTPTGSGWTEKVLHNFTGGTDGFAPDFQLTADAKGNFYGVALTGGNTTNCASHTYGCGTAYKLSHGTAGWNFQALYEFTDSDSSAPASGLLLDAKGNLYGSGVGGKGGIVYQLSPAGGKIWKDTVLFTFDVSNGYLPQGLAFDSAGNLYGPTYQGGTGGGLVQCQDLQPGCGTAFKLTHTSSGWTESVLHNFTGQDANPNGGMVFDVAGNLYGADAIDVYKLSRSNGIWKKTALHAFGGAGDGSSPRAPLLLDASGNVLGVTYQGGASGAGTVFEITP